VYLEAENEAMPSDAEIGTILLGLAEFQSTVREVEGSSLRPDQHSGS